MMASPTMTLVSLFLTVITTGGALIYCLCIEKRSALSMGFRKGTFWRSYSKGFLIGTGLLLLCCGIGYILGGFTVSSVMTLTPAYGVLFLLGFVIQGSSEEVLLRGYFMMSLSNRCRTSWAVGISSVVFSLLHIANPGFGLLPFINISLFGMFMGLYVYREGDLWGACAIHSAWNFVQGNILGVQVSGTGALPTLWQFQPIEGKTLISGGAFGIEASIIVTAVLLATIAITYFGLSTRHADAS
jgi:membrane protease YdiL (CAAX protease family)